MTISNQAYIDAVLAKCEALMSAQLWAREPVVRPRRWLNNFKDDERTAAAILLDSFVFYAEAQKSRLLKGAFEAAVRTPKSDPRCLPQDFLRDALFTLVRGENPNITDSSFQMTRMVRQQLDVREERFVELPDALERARTGTPIIFMDDVTITGDQFMDTWELEQHGHGSFASLAKAVPIHTACIYLIATAAARKRIESSAQPTRLFATHCIDASHEYKALQNRQPPPLVPNAQALVENLLHSYAPRLTFRTEDAYMLSEPDWAKFGYKCRGLLFAMENNVPDGTLPIFWATGPTSDWTPLVRRT